MTHESWTVPAILSRWIDGDTPVVDLDLGWRVYRNNEHIRIAGINAPEFETVEGKAAAKWANELIPPGTKVMVTSEAKPSFERTVGSLSYFGEDGLPKDYAMQAVRDGYAELVLK